MAEAPWAKWWQPDLPCAFSQAQAAENCAYLTELLGAAWLERGLSSPGFAEHPILQRWKGGAPAFLELNTLAEDAKILGQVPGFGQVISDLLDTERSTPAWHVVHTAALFERAAPRTVVEFLPQTETPSPDFKMEVRGKTIGCEAKALLTSDKEQAFYDYAFPLVESVFEGVLASPTLHPTVLIVIKDVDRLPQVSEVIGAVVEANQLFSGSQIKVSRSQFNIFIAPIHHLAPLQNLGEHRLCYVLCPRSPNEDLRVQERSKQAARQLRSLAELTGGLFSVRVSEYQNPHTILNTLNRRFLRGEYHAMSGVMLMRSATQLGPPRRTPVDLIVTAHNPRAVFPLPNLPMRAAGLLVPLLKEVPPKDVVPAYHYGSTIVGGTGPLGAFVPDIRLLTKDML
jgi:hypothetical protein